MGEVPTDVTSGGQSVKVSLYFGVVLTAAATAAVIVVLFVPR